jgi:phage-related minor tail protein
MEKFRELSFEELSQNDTLTIDGGLIPAAVALWWAGASLAAKCGVVAGGVVVVGGAGAIGYYNGYFDTKK